MTKIFNDSTMLLQGSVGSRRWSRNLDYDGGNRELRRSEGESPIEQDLKKIREYAQQLKEKVNTYKQH